MPRDLLTDVKQLYNQQVRQHCGEPVGCSKDAIAKLEDVIGYRLPLTYRQYLPWMGCNRGRGMAFVLVRDSEIIARANLKDICRDSQTAEAGYRVAKDSTGQGVGTRCVGRFIQEAMSLKFLSKIRGYVLDNNPGSARILQKHGFQ